MLGRVSQSVTCLTVDTCVRADPGMAGLLLAQSHTFAEIDHEIVSTPILLPSAESFKKDNTVVVSYKQKYVHEVLVNHFIFQLAQEKKVWLGELIIPT